MSDDDKIVYNKVSNEIYKLHRVRLSVDDIHKIVFEYFKFVKHCLKNKIQVRLPYLGVFKVSMTTYYKDIYYKKMSALGFSPKYILSKLQDGTWKESLNQIKENDKTVFVIRKGTPT